ncbi:MAG: hypothetical protein GF331_01510 [Chitinivibrionales bacterium]|nr:hypothetical protein [Chitinivibrionales bacterium]
MRSATRAVLTILLGATVLSAATVSIDLSTRYQTIEGFGAFMHISPWREKQGPFYYDVDLDAVHIYDSVISRLGVTMIRVFTDASFEADSGVYEVTGSGEFGMINQFKHMRKLKAAAERHGEPLEFIISVLSPPAYMKPSGQVVGGMEAAPNYYETDCRLKDGYDDEFARYLVNYLNVQKDSTGIDMYALNIQNEPAFQEPYASCVYNGPRYTSVSKAVGQALEAAGIPTPLFGAEHMSWAFPNAFENHVRSDPDALKYFKAWAVHGYTDGNSADTGSYSGATATDKAFWMTETSGSSFGATTNGINDWPGAMTLARQIHGYLRNARMSAWVWYHLQSASSSGYATNTDGLIADTSFTAKAYVSQHFYRYIRPGARQVASTCDDNQVKVVAFYHEENDCYTLVFMNETSGPKTVNALNGAGLPSQWTLLVSTESAKVVESTVNTGQAFTLPASSIATLVAGTYRGTPTIASAKPPSATRGPVPAGFQLARTQTYDLRGRLVSGNARMHILKTLAPAFYCRRSATGATTLSVPLNHTNGD